MAASRDPAQVLDSRPTSRPRLRAGRAQRDGRTRDGRDLQSLASLAAEQLLEDIIQCRLRPGDLVQLSSLEDRYRMSRMPIREALTALQREGLVSSVPYKGYLIRPLDVEDVNEIYYLRQLLEGASAELAATAINPDELEQLAALRAPDTLIMTLEYDRYARTFHGIVAAASRNQRLEEAILRTYNDVRRLMYAGIGQPRPDMVTQEHAEVLSALRAHDSDRARAAMVDHITNIRKRALRE